MKKATKCVAGSQISNLRMRSHKTNRKLELQCQQRNQLESRGFDQRKPREKNEANLQTLEKNVGEIGTREAPQLHPQRSVAFVLILVFRRLKTVFGVFSISV